MKEEIIIQKIEKSLNECKERWGAFDANERPLTVKSQIALHHETRLLIEIFGVERLFLEKDKAEKRLSNFEREYSDILKNRDAFKDKFQEALEYLKFNHKLDGAKKLISIFSFIESISETP